MYYSDKYGQYMNFTTATAACSVFKNTNNKDAFITINLIIQLLILECQSLF